MASSPGARQALPFGVAELLDAVAGAARVLDVGCGSGRLTVALARSDRVAALFDETADAAPIGGNSSETINQKQPLDTPPTVPSWTGPHLPPFVFRPAVTGCVVSIASDKPFQGTRSDWDAIFAFTQSPNGNFAFNFFIALRAQPELKFNYDRRSYKRTPGGFQ